MLIDDFNYHSVTSGACTSSAPRTLDSLHACSDEPQSGWNHQRSRGRRRRGMINRGGKKSVGRSVVTHQTRSGPGRLGGAGWSRERRLDISRDADTPLPELDTFLRLCVKTSVRSSHSLRPQFNFEPLQKKKKKILRLNQSTQNRCAVFATLWRRTYSSLVVRG